MKLATFRVQFLMQALLAALPLAAAPAGEAQDPPSSEDEVVVLRAAGTETPESSARDLATSPGSASGEQLSAELMRPLRPAPDLEACRLPALRVEILDPATRRAVIREGSNPPRVVKPGSVLAGSAAVVREIGIDKLVAEAASSDGGPGPLWWIYAAAPEGGKRSRVQCFVAAGEVPEPAPRAAISEPGSDR